MVGPTPCCVDPLESAVPPPPTAAAGSSPAVTSTPHVDTVSCGGADSRLWERSSARGTGLTALVLMERAARVRDAGLLTVATAAVAVEAPPVATATAGGGTPVAVGSEIALPRFRERAVASILCFASAPSLSGGALFAGACTSASSGCGCSAAAIDNGTASTSETLL